MQPSARHVRGFLECSDAVSALLSELQRREALLARIRSLLPASIARHCTQAIIDDGRLTLTCDSPVWVDRLRFLAPQFLPALTDLGEAAMRCRIRAQPIAPGSPGAAHHRPRPDSGSDAVHALEQTAVALGDTPLADSLRRLARTLAGA